MSTLAVLTPSYGPDIELCRDLNRSVLRWTGPDVRHVVIVPRRDRALFAPLRGARTEVRTIDELLPRRMAAVPGANAWVNLRRPFPPVRGWVMQQVVKLRAAAEAGADVVLLADSDVRLVRPVDAGRFLAGGRVSFLRREGAIDAGMRRHVLWHGVAHRLLGLGDAPAPPLADYVNAFNVWDASVVRALLERIEGVAGRPWTDVVAAELHVSEFVLYGVFVDCVLGRDAPVAPTAALPCHDYWHPAPLSADAARDFVGAIASGDVAVMISAKSRTPLDVRRRALEAVRTPTPLER